VIDRRRDLVSAAYQRIASEGFEGLRTRDVAADAGVNIATLHYYFPTKEALIRGVIGQAMQRFNATLPAHGSPVQQLRGHLRALSELMKSDRQLWAVLGELVLRAPRDADLARIFRETDEYWHRTLVGLLSACIAEGALDVHLDVDETASLMMATLKGLSLPTMAGSDPRVADKVFGQLERLLGLSPKEE
jgi:AcrR family transcriptional regulator